MALKTQLGLTFTNSKLTDIQLCNVDTCKTLVDKYQLEEFNFSIIHYNEPMKLRVMAKNFENRGPFKLFDIAVYNRDICQGLFDC